MDANKSEMDDLLKNAMQFNEGEVPEPNMVNYNKLRNKVKSHKKYISPWVKVFTLEIKLYQAALATVAVAVVCVLLKSAPLPQTSNNLNQLGADTITTYKGTSLKSDSFLVKNFTTTIY